MMLDLPAIGLVMLSLATGGLVMICLVVLAEGASARP